MVEFEGPKVDLGISPQDLAKEIQDLNNLGDLLPSGAVKDFESAGDKCSFKVTGGVAIHLEKDPASHTDELILKMSTVAPTPVKFTLEVKATELSNGCTCYVRSDADLNPFTRMMVEPALKSLFEEISKGMLAKYPLNL
jgi:hypothetical protein